MWIDVTLLSLIGLFAVFGIWQGGTAQILRILAAVAAVIGAPLAARELSGPMGGLFVDLPPAAVYGISLIAGAICIYLVLSIVIYFITEVIIDSSTLLTAADRLVGLAFGLLKGTILVFVISHGLIALSPSFPELRVQESEVVRTVGKIRVDALIDIPSIESRLL